MTSTQTSPRARPRPGRPARSAFLVAAVVATTALVVVVLPLLLRGPDFVDRLTIDNPTAVPVEVSVRAAGSEAALALGTASPRARTTFESIVDPGGRWTVRFVANGEAVAETEVTRERLERGEWRFTIPDSVREALIRRGGVAAPGSAGPG
jgi:hypothetical protein